MSDNQDALRLADDLIHAFSGQGLCAYAAAELRRLHAELERKSDAIQRLRKERDELRSENRTLVRQNGEWQALNAELVEALQRYHRIVCANAIDLDCDAAIDKAHAALAKVEASK